MLDQETPTQSQDQLAHTEDLEPVEETVVRDVEKA
jgi:hypothetical protein